MRGAALFINPDTSAFGRAISRRAVRDPLFRETIVYLTCLHELGHALGLAHSDGYRDIMYDFGLGGDIEGYFQRYRRKLGSRADIREKSGLSHSDRAQVRAHYANRREP